MLDSITAEPLTGLRSIAAGLHGRAGKEPPPARGETTTWAERTPAQASAEIQAADQMADQRQAELGRQLAAQAAGVGRAGVGRARQQEPGALRDDWQQRAGLVGHYREVAGITDPAQAIGPVPSAQPDLAEMFHASVRALQLPDEAALLKAMGQGELEAAVDEHDRAIALAPADVQAEIDERRSRVGRRPGPRPHRRRRPGRRGAGRRPRREAQDAAADLARLAVADAARREWAEAHAGLGGPGRGGRARAPRPRPGRADPGDRRRGGRSLGGAARDAGDRPGRLGPAGRPSRPPGSTPTGRPSASRWRG